MKSTTIRVMEETTAILPLSKMSEMRYIIQVERYTCSPSHPMMKIMETMTKHRINIPHSSEQQLEEDLQQQL